MYQTFWFKRIRKKKSKKINVGLFLQESFLCNCFTDIRFDMRKLLEQSINDSLKILLKCYKDNPKIL